MKAVLLLHGFATDRDDFAKIVPILSCSYDEVVCQNLPAHGKGVKGRLNKDTTLDFVLKAFDGLKQRHKTVDVIGFSFGGALATMLASVREVNRLVLLAPANRYIAPFFMLKTIKRLAYVCVKGKRIKKDNASNLGLKDMLCDAGFCLKLLFTKLLRKYSPLNLISFKRIIRHCNKNLKPINVPTLIIYGRLDQLVPYSSVKHVLGHLRHDQSKVIVYKDMSHLMLYSKAHFKVADDIYRFLLFTDPPRLEYKQRAD